MRLIECAQNTPEWIQARLGIPTGSTFSSVLAEGYRGEEAMSRRSLRAKLALERVTGQQKGGYSSYATRQGHEREPGAKHAYEVETGRLLTNVGFCRHDTLATGCSPDALVDDDPEGPGGVEVKSPEEAAHLETIVQERCPPRYVAQVQGCMWICARRWWDFVSWNPDFPPGGQLVIVRVRRDERFIDRLRREVELFIGEVDEAEQALRAAMARRRAARDWLEAA